MLNEGKLSLKDEYISSIQSNTNWYWGNFKHREVVTILSFTIFHAYMDVSIGKYVAQILIIVCNINQINILRIYPIYIIEEEHEHIKDEIIHI